MDQREIDKAKAQYLDDAAKGDKWRDIINGGTWKIIDTEIFKPLLEDADDLFMNSSPSDYATIARCQAIKKILGDINKKVASILENGIHARELLTDLQQLDSTPPGGANVSRK